MFRFYIFNSVVLKGEFQSQRGGALGAARPQTCARVLRTLDPQPAK